MVDPVSVCVAAAVPVVRAVLGNETLFKKIVDGVIGNRADAAIVGLTKWGQHQINLRTQDPALNHDLERGTREAYLGATLELIRQALVRAQASSGGLMSAGLVEALTQVEDAIKADLRDVSNTLPRTLKDSHLFLLDADSVPADGLERLRETLRRNLVEDFARWLPGQPMPPVVEELLRDGWLISTSYQQHVRRDWHSLIGIVFVEKLKSTPRLATVFESRLLAQIAAREPAAAPIASFSGFQAKFEEITVPLQRIEDSLGLLHRRIDDVHRDVVDIKTDVREVKEAARGLERIPRLMWSSAALLALAATAVLATESGARTLCRVPGVRSVCSYAGVGGVATASEESLWRARAPGDCDGLRTYRQQFPNGAYAEEAARRLAAIERGRNVTWEPGVRRYGTAIGATVDSFPSEQEARVDALRRAGRNALTVTCASLDSPDGEFRLRSAQVVPLEWGCRKRANGVACSLEFQAVCEVDVKQDAGYCQ